MQYESAYYAYNYPKMAFSHIARYYFKIGSRNLWKHYGFLSGHITIDPFGIDGAGIPIEIDQDATFLR